MPMWKRHFFQVLKLYSILSLNVLYTTFTTSLFKKKQTPKMQKSDGFASFDLWDVNKKEPILLWPYLNSIALLFHSTIFSSIYQEHPILKIFVQNLILTTTFATVVNIKWKLNMRKSNMPFCYWLIWWSLEIHYFNIHDIKADKHWQ